MASKRRYCPARRNYPFMRPSQIRNLIILSFSVLFLGWLVGSAADYTIEYNWWKEVGQVDTWFGMLWYSIAPAAVGSVLAFVALWMAHASGLRFAGVRQKDFPIYSRLIPVGLALVAIMFASASIDYWTVMRFFGSRGIAVPADAWKDQVFSRGLPFYLFDLPFYSQLLGFAFVLAILCALLFWATARGWQLAERFRYGQLTSGQGNTLVLGPNTLLLPGASRAGIVRIIGVILVAGFAVWVF